MTPNAEPDGVCRYCEEPLEPGVVHNIHEECMIRMVAGSAAHQLQECSCYGGTRHDPPGVGLREGARLARQTFLTLNFQRPTKCITDKKSRTERVRCTKSNEQTKRNDP